MCPEPAPGHSRGCCEHTTAPKAGALAVAAAFVRPSSVL